VFLWPSPEVDALPETVDWDLLDLDEALDQLEAEDPRAAKLVKLRFIAGFKREDAALEVGVSVSTVNNDWAYAKCWLQVKLADTSEADH
jgi:RNA polymerase sigma-70 factor (ECF subfamily)